ncbi:MAG: hypothetical protein AB7T38_02675 [Nitrospirales bacterium]
MGRPKGTNVVKETVYFSREAYSALQNFQEKYPKRSVSDITNAAVLYLKKQAGGLGLDANCEPFNQKTIKAIIHEIAAEERPFYGNKDGPTKEKRPANDSRRS